jgi:hypothetical protein
MVGVSAHINFEGGDRPDDTFATVLRHRVEIVPETNPSLIRKSFQC